MFVYRNVDQGLQHMNGADLPCDIFGPTNYANGCLCRVTIERTSLHTEFDQVCGSTFMRMSSRKTGIFSLSMLVCRIEVVITPT